ncbi:hypothetical protein AWZ03_011257 [Drosophila navojoa]|uniref:Uncharacterized protein n=1 Tax=Drosophila navojoa TaxID=7232 RepID=A0A484B3C2_DRONA|nr:hypothetical protein AWZ03_011257 [Drosophila navojoa]
MWPNVGGGRVGGGWIQSQLFGWAQKHKAINESCHAVGEQELVKGMPEPKQEQEQEQELELSVGDSWLPVEGGCQNMKYARCQALTTSQSVSQSVSQSAYQSVIHVSQSRQLQNFLRS